ncbi:hypothetical protein H632_c3801p0, partial [Helicosporidium sp. ATCC 50920]
MLPILDASCSRARDKNPIMKFESERKLSLADIGHARLSSAPSCTSFAIVNAQICISALDIMEEWMDAEADVESVVADAQPRRLSRLKKHGQLRARPSRAAGLPVTLDSDISENADPTVAVEPQILADAVEGESAAHSPRLRGGVHGARTAPDAAVAREEDYWDEEDELEEYLNTRLEDAKKPARPSKSSACTAHVETEDSGEESAPEQGDDAATTAYLLRAAARG